MPNPEPRHRIGKDTTPAMREVEARLRGAHGLFRPEQRMETVSLGLLRPLALSREDVRSMPEYPLDSAQRVGVGDKFVVSGTISVSDRGLVTFSTLHRTTRRSDSIIVTNVSLGEAGALLPYQGDIVSGVIAIDGIRAQGGYTGRIADVLGILPPLRIPRSR